MTDTPRRYRVISVEDKEAADTDGNLVAIPAGTVLTVILWDGVSEWTPPEGTRVEVEQ